jgi:rare lipoprotein A
VLRKLAGRSPEFLYGLVVALALGGCAGRAEVPAVVETGWSETGVASWYGEPFHGRRTASGEVYDMELMTAAHRTLPLGTVVRVESRDNGRTVEVRINDRGPFVGGRIIDLSRAAARLLDMLGPGTARVRVTVVQAVENPGVPMWECIELQVGAFQDPELAAALRRHVLEAGYDARSEVGPDGLLRVIAGPFDSAADAEAAKRQFDGFYHRCDSSR